MATLKPSWKSHQMTPFFVQKEVLGEEIIIWVKYGNVFTETPFLNQKIVIHQVTFWLLQNDKVFTQMMIFFTHFFERKNLSFDDFLMTTWERENKSERKKKPQIPRLYNDFGWMS